MSTRQSLLVPLSVHLTSSPVINVSLGIWQYSRLAYGQTDNSRYYPFWIWIAFLIVYTFWDSFLFVYSKWIGPRLEKMWKIRENELEMRLTNEDTSDLEDSSNKVASKVESRGAVLCCSHAVHAHISSTRLTSASL